MAKQTSSLAIGIAIGIAAGIGLTICFILHDISINMRAKQATAESVSYIYDEQNRLKSIVPMTLKPV